VSKILRALFCAALVATAPGCGLATTIALIATSGSSSRSSGAVPAPQVSSVTPSQVSHGGGETITIRGENFPSDATVSIGGVTAPNVQFISGQELRLVVPRNPLVGTASVVVTNPNGGSGTFSSGFTLTNQLPSATFGPLATPQAQNVVLSVTLTDAESDMIDLALEVDTGNGVFQTIPSSQILSGALIGIASSPQGVEHKLTWNSAVILPSQDASAVRFRATPRDTSDQQDGTQATSTSFAVQNNTPVSLDLSQPGNDAFNVALSYRISDPDPSDPVQIVSLTWRDVGSGQTGSMTLSSGQAPGSVTTSASGTNFSTVWNSFQDLGFGNNRLVDVTVTVSDGTTTVSARSNPFFVSNGPLSDQVVVGALLDVEGVACGDVTGDGLPDLVIGSTNLIGGADPAPGGRIGLLVNQQQGFAGSVNTSPPIIGNGAVPPAGGATAGSNGLPNYFAGNRPHPSESTLVDIDGDGDLDLLSANSPHAPFVPGVDLLSRISDVLANAAGEGGIYPNATAHQVTLQALQAGGTLDVAGGTWQSSQALVTASAPIYTGGSTLATGTTLTSLGWFTQDLATAELDASGSGGGQDAVILQGIAQLRDAIAFPGVIQSSRPQRGVIVLRKQGGAGLGLSSTSFLDPGPMGTVPVQVAVADVTSSAHAAGFPGGGPVRTPAAGLPDLISVNAGDNSLTFYIQTQASGTPNTTPGEYHGVRLPLSPLVGVLLSNPAFNLPPGDLRGIAIGDLNGDGANDFVVCGQLSKVALVFIYDPASAGALSLNNNTGGPYTTLTAGLLPFRLAGSITLPSIRVGRPSIGDLTGDGRNDIVFPQSFANEVALYPNRGNHPANGALGQSTATPLFGAAPGATDPLPPNPSPVIFASEFQPFDTCIADFDADQRNDLLVAAGLSFDLSAYYQTTAGTLDNLIPIPAGGAPFLLAAGDVTGDGIPEIAATLQNANEVRVFERNSTSFLSNLKTYDVDGATGVRNVAPYLVAPSFPFGIRIRELNQDGIPDIVAAAEIIVQGQAVTTSNVAQTLNTTAGWFYAAGGNPVGADIAVVRTSTISPIAFSVDVGDVLGADGIPDVVVSHNQGNGVVFYRGLGGGNFAGDPSGPNRIIPLAIGSGAECLIVDLNGDGVYLDVIQASAFEATGLRVRYGSAGGPDPAAPGEFVTIPTTGVGAPVAIQVVDVGGPTGPGGEALPDIIFTGFTVKSAGILFQNTRAVLSNPPTFTGVKLTTGGEPSQIAVGDLNGDGLSDIAFPWGTDNKLAVYYRNPSATSVTNTFFGPATFPTANSPIGCVIVDVDGDGRNDVVVSARGASALNVFLQR